MFKTFAKTAIAGLLLTAGMAQAASTTYVDMFSFGQKVQADAPGTAFGRATDASSPSSILGNDREITVTATGDNSATARVGFSGFYGANVLSLSNDTGTAGKYTIIWDGNTGGDSDSTTPDYSGFLLSLSKSDSFLYHVYSVDLGAAAFYFGITLYDTDGDNVTLEIDGTATHVGGDATISVGTIVDSPFSVTDLSGNGSFDLTNLGAIKLVVNSDVNVDMTIGAVKVVPEPAGLALVGAALAGLGLSRRRRSAR